MAVLDGTQPDPWFRPAADVSSDPGSGRPVNPALEADRCWTAPSRTESVSGSARIPNLVRHLSCRSSLTRPVRQDGPPSCSSEPEVQNRRFGPNRDQRSSLILLHFLLVLENISFLLHWNQSDPFSGPEPLQLQSVPGSLTVSGEC